ncbi:heparin lyase I family protein [Synechococcus sp. PCC 7336]|uniref:heparin lyase I family protein n=1 Tax=Synechococcus sp. PCC 7336 TaxID=195250 RepID=UPI00138AC5B4|nr:heparin lyase I family protein [Synechococcus sp. PCC 7336]
MKRLSMLARRIASPSAFTLPVKRLSPFTSSLASLLLLLLLIACPATSASISVDFQAGSDWLARDWNIGNYTEGCQTARDGMTIVPTPDGADPNNRVGKVSLNSCGLTEIDGKRWSRSDNRGEGFVMPYRDRDRIELGKVYTYTFSLYIPDQFGDFRHDRDGGNWAIVSQWPCWSSDPAQTCPKQDPDRYCGNGAIGPELKWSDYQYRLRFRVRNVEEGEDDCIDIRGIPSARGGWDRHIVQIVWDADNSGSLRWWIAGKLVSEVRDFRTWWDAPIVKPAWKLGMYMGSGRDGPWSATDNNVTLFFDGLGVYKEMPLSTICPNCERP